MARYTQGMRNGRHVADNRDFFLYGDSELMPLRSAVEAMNQVLRSADVVVGHAASATKGETTRVETKRRLET